MEHDDSLIYLHAWHGGVVHVVVAAVIIVDRPDLTRIGFVWIHMHHPAENVGQKNSAGRVARFLGVDGTEQSEFRIATAVGRELSRWRLAEIHVLMPMGDAEGNAVVDLILIGSDAVGV